MSSTSFLCCCKVSATDMREIFLLSGFFYTLFSSYSPSRDLAQPAFIKASLGTGTSSLKVAGPPTKVRSRSSASVCLNHSVQLKILVGKLDLCVKPSEHYINLFHVLNPFLSSYIYCTSHVISTRPQKSVMNSDLKVYLHAAY